MRIRISVLLIALLLVFSNNVACGNTNELVPVEIKGKWGFKDADNRIVIQPKFDAVSAFGFFEGLIAVRANGKWGYIDSHGTWVITPEFDFTQLFSEGLAAVNIGGEVFADIIATGGKWGYVNRTGRMVIPERFEEAQFFNEDLAAVKENGLWGFIDKKGEMIVANRFEAVQMFCDGLAAVRVDKKWGFVDKTGRIAISPQFDDVGFFGEGVVAVKIGGKWGFADRTGRIAIKPDFDYADRFVRGRAQVRNNDRLYQIDRTGADFGNWDYLTSSKDRSYYYDPKTISRSNDIIKVWIKDASRSGVESRKTLYEIDCSKRYLRLLSTVLYGEEGRVLYSGTTTGEWGPIAPETVADGYREGLCKKQEVGNSMKGESKKKQTVKQRK